MAQVIVYTRSNGQVALCIPSGELHIEEVLKKDCPEGAIIIDDSELPTDYTYFDAWELVNGKVTVNETKKTAIISSQQTQENAKTSAQSKLAALGLTADEIAHLIGAE